MVSEGTCNFRLNDIYASMDLYFGILCIEGKLCDGQEEVIVAKHSRPVKHSQRRTAFPPD